MNQYRRIVSYLYKYGNGKKGENTGFVRIDTRPEGIRLHIRIRDLRMMDEKRLKVYFYFHKENRLQLIFVDEFLCVRGNCEYKKLVLPDFTDGDFERLNGVIFLDEQGLLYGSCWDEREISEDLLTEKEEKNEELFLEQEVFAKEESIAEEKIANEEILVKEETADEEIMSEEVTAQEEIPVEETAETMLSQFPRLNLSHLDGILQAVEIRIEDMPMLSVKDWKLADNAFLKQAYEADSHLLLGKVKMQNEDVAWILGVPGIYENREKYLAGIFGFTEYIPLENREYKTGGRGYWIRQIEKVE